MQRGSFSYILSTIHVFHCGSTFVLDRFIITESMLEWTSLSLFMSNLIGLLFTFSKLDFICVHEKRLQLVNCHEKPMEEIQQTGCQNHFLNMKCRLSLFLFGHRPHRLLEELVDGPNSKTDLFEADGVGSTS